MMKIIQTKQQRANTLDALNVMWPSVPPENVVPELVEWRDDISGGKPDCHTIACFGGWCAWWPNFKDQGITANSVGAPTMRNVSIGSQRVSEFLFGKPDMFAQRGHCSIDHRPGIDPLNEMYAGHDETDHQLVTRRLKWLLENSEVNE